MVTGLVATPLVLLWLGTERYGALRALTDWMGYIALLELGVSGAIQPILAAVLARGNQSETTQVVATAVRAYLRVMGLMLIAGFGLTGAVQYLIPVEAHLIGELIIATAVNVAGVLLLPLTVYRWLTEAGQRGYLVNLMLAIQSLTTAGLSVTFAWTDWGLPGQSLALLVGSIVFQGGLVWIGLSRHPYLIRMRWSVRAPEQEAKLAALNRPALVFNLCARLSIFSDSIILSMILGPAAVVPYYLTQRLILLSAGYVVAIANSTWAALAELYYQGRIEDLNRHICRLTLIAGVLSGGLLVPITVANASFVRLWVGFEQYGGAGITILTVIFAWGQNLVAIWGWVINGTGNVRRMIPCMIAGAGINLGVSILGTWYFGLIGPALGSAVQYGLVMTAWFPLLLQRHFGTSIRALLGAVVRPVAVAVPYIVGLLLFAEAVPPYGPDWPRWACWLGLAGWLAGAACGYFLLAWFFALPADDRTEWLGRFRGWVRRT